MSISKSYLKSILVTFILLVGATVIYYVALNNIIFHTVTGLVQLTFWCIGLPAIAYSSSKLWKDVHLVSNAIISSLLFYGFMYFMTYKQLDSDFGSVMKYGFFVTVIGIPLYHLYNTLYDRYFAK